VLAIRVGFWENYMTVVLDPERLMTLGLAERQGDLLDDVNRFCDQALVESSVYAVLHRERDRLFPDEMFSDLFSERGRRSVPPSVVATVMVLQRLEGLSDREATERYTFDARWRYAAGVGGYDGDGWASFAHTVLVDMRARLAASENPRPIFEVTVEAASAAGLVGAKRVLDSTPLYDAVATMDTITLIRSAMRGLLKAADTKLEAELRTVMRSGDDYVSWSCGESIARTLGTGPSSGCIHHQSSLRRSRSSARSWADAPAISSRSLSSRIRASS
jgi:hypothetical protein